MHASSRAQAPACNLTHANLPHAHRASPRPRFAHRFVGLGGSAITAWGDTSECLNANCSLRLPDGVRMGPDTRGGAQPHNTSVRANLVREIGLWQKQSSMWFQAVAAQSSVQGHASSLKTPSQPSTSPVTILAVLGTVLSGCSICMLVGGRQRLLQRAACRAQLQRRRLWRRRHLSQPARQYMP